jgi:hypothetical protein
MHRSQRRLMVIVRAALIVLLVAITDAASEELAVHLSYTDGQTTVCAGQSLALTLEYRNVGYENLLLFRSEAMGPADLDIVATHGTDKIHCSANRLTYDRRTERFLIVPLLPNRSLLERVVLNDVGAVESPLLPLDPGEYGLKAILSGGRTSSPGGETLWQGRATSNELMTNVVSPAEKEVARWRMRLKAALESNPYDAFVEVRYFSLVRDNAAADLLLALLPHSDWDSNVVRAIAFQRRCTDLPYLEALQENPMYANAAGRHFIEETMTTIRKNSCAP